VSDRAAIGTAQEQVQVCAESSGQHRRLEDRAQAIEQRAALDFGYTRLRATMAWSRADRPTPHLGQ